MVYFRKEVDTKIAELQLKTGKVSIVSSLPPSKPVEGPKNEPLDIDESVVDIWKRKDFPWTRNIKKAMKL